MNTYEDRIRKLAALLSTHSRIVFFGGAGVSTESDIPDFRGSGGIYRRPGQSLWSAEEMLSHHFYLEHPKEFFDNYKEREGFMRDVSPNRAHYALARLEKEGRLAAVVTQNIDGLHQRAGSRRVYELHGSVHRNYCTECRAFFDIDSFIALCTPIPHCPQCGGIIKPDVVLYEESLDTDVLMDAVDAIRDADLLIIGGTSLVVYPAAGLIREYRGEQIVLINRDPTPGDRYANVLFHESIGDVLEKSVALLSPPTV